MTFNVYYFFQLIAIFIMLGWAVYVNYRNGQLNMAPIYTMAIGAYFSAYAVVDSLQPWGQGLAFYRHSDLAEPQLLLPP